MSLTSAFRDNDYDQDGFRTCSVTGLSIHRSAENMVKVFGLTAVVALLVAGIAATGVALTRWEAIHLLNSGDYYKFLSVHAWNALIFWMVFMEIAILYVGGPFILGRKLSWKRLAHVGYAVMLIAAIWINVAVWVTSAPNQQPLLTSYAPLPSSQWFYLGAIVFILGTTVAAVPFFKTIWDHKRENKGQSLPLITFGAFATSIIAVEALLGGLGAYIPAYLWRIGVLSTIDPVFYRQMYWIIGHGTQQINLVAMITIWYFMTHVVGGAEVASEKVSRTAFVMYVFFINMGAAHHLLSDPAVSTGWRIWNTSYASYGAVIASMIHAFAIPAGLEAGRRAKNKGGGLFGWLWTAPWRDPGFSSIVMSIILFGFLGGITGVMMGQMQLNMTWHNTLATVGHFHGTVVTGTTLAFMGLVYYVLRLVFRKEWVAKPVMVAQPYLYAGAMSIVVLMMMYLGILYGIPRRHPSVMNIPGTEFSFEAAQPLFIIFGIGAVLAIIGGALFLVLAVATLLFGDDLEQRAPDSTPAAVAADGGTPENGDDAESESESESVVESRSNGDKPIHAYSMRGTFVMTLVFLVTFGVMLALNWYLLSQLWQIGP